MMRMSRVNEKEFQERVIDLLHYSGYRVAHFLPAMNQRGQWRTPVSADGKGFPDLVAVRSSANGRREQRIIFSELKRNDGRLTKEQKGWGEDLLGAGAEYYVWRPRDWEEIVTIVGRRPRKYS